MIAGKIREFDNFSKQIGIGEFSLIHVCPDLEQLKEIYPNAEKLVEPHYITSKSDDFGDYDIANIVFYLKNVKTGKIDKTNIMVSSRERVAGEDKGFKPQWINNIGSTVWAKDENDLKSMVSDSTYRNDKGQPLSDGYKTYLSNFMKRPYRKALNGEEQLYDFILKITKIDNRDPEAELVFNSKKWFAENFKELQKDLLDKSFASNTIVGCYEVVSKMIAAHPDPETAELIPESWKFYQGIYNKFLPGSYIGSFGTEKPYPKFVQAWVDQLCDPKNGSKNFFANKINGKINLTLARDYVESENQLVSDPTSKHEDVPNTPNVPEHIGVDDLPF